MTMSMLTTLAIIVTIAFPSVAQAHFLWLVMDTQSEAPTVKIYSGDTAISDDPDLLDRVAGAEA
jgi:hypothetical protein